LEILSLILDKYPWLGDLNLDSFDRVYAALKGNTVDRAPVFPQIGDHAGIINGLSFNTMYRDAKKAAEAHIKALKLYGYDITTIQVEPSWPVSESCGASVNYPLNKNPWITKFPIEEKNSLEELEIPDFMGCRSTRVMIEGTNLLAKKANVPIAAYMTGPITFSFQLMPYELLIPTMIKDPEFTHLLVKKSIEIIKEYIKLLKEAGASILVLCEHDYQLLKPQQVKEFSSDYIENLLNVYDFNILHMCGKISTHLQYLGNTIKQIKNLDMISIDSIIGIREARDVLENKIGIAGNIDHIRLLPHGSPQEVKEAVFNALRENRNNPRFLVAPGCEITADTPIENVKVLVSASKSFKI
jgi:uroporphyrinogen decarboxylase